MKKIKTCRGCQNPVKRKEGRCTYCKKFITKTGALLALCPSCKEPVYRRYDGKCKSCDAVLILEKVREGNFSVTRYKLPDQVGKDLKQVEQIKRVPVRLPELKLLDNVVKQTDAKKWQVIFRIQPQRVVCPNCRKLQFMNILTMNAKLERKCKCGHVTTYLFEVLP